MTTRAGAGGRTHSTIHVTAASTPTPTSAASASRRHRGRYGTRGGAARHAGPGGVGGVGAGPRHGDEDPLLMSSQSRGSQTVIMCVRIVAAQSADHGTATTGRFFLGCDELPGKGQLVSRRRVSVQIG